MGFRRSFRERNYIADVYYSENGTETFALNDGTASLLMYKRIFLLASSYIMRRGITPCHWLTLSKNYKQMIKSNKNILSELKEIFKKSRKDLGK